jgi:dinuclear metal center YbgI/SA1388 family protein
MKLGEIVAELERIAPPALQEDYDNSGLIVGDPKREVHKALLCLDSTEAIIDEAIREGCDMVIAHHPIVFRGLKRFNGKNYIERAVIKAIENRIAIYACHTNLDNVLHQGVNSKIAQKLGLLNSAVLLPKAGHLNKLAVFVPEAHAAAVRDAMFAAGAGHIGNYSECSFNLSGSGTFKASEHSKPFVGELDRRHTEQEVRIEVVVPKFELSRVWKAIQGVHPYEEIAYDVYELANAWSGVGSGLVGDLPEPMAAVDFLALLKEKMELPLVRFTKTNDDKVQRIAVCGGAGSFLIGPAKQSGAQVLVTSDIRYHEFFDAEDRLLLCDIGHFESEKYTTELFAEILSVKFRNFATIFAKTITNPVNYYF